MIEIMELAKITIEDLLQRYARGEREFRNLLVTTEFDLRGVNLEGADLINTSFAELDMTGTKLARANLSGACLEQTLLHDADLSEANLCGAFLNQTEFIGANLSDAYLINASDIWLANFGRANLTNAILRNAFDEREPIILQDAFMEEAFGRVNLTRANLAGVKGFSLDSILDGAIMPNGNNQS